MNENNQGAGTGTLHIVPEPPLERAERLLRAFLSIPNGRTRDLAASAVVRVVEHLLDEAEAPAPDRILVAINDSQEATEENPLDLTPFLEKSRRIREEEQEMDAAFRRVFGTNAIRTDDIDWDAAADPAPAKPIVVETERPEDPVVLVGRSLADVAELNPAPGAARKQANEIDDALEIARTMAKVDNLRLHHVLDIYRLEGRACGVQVLAADRVVCWVGNLKQAIRNGMMPLQLWYDHTEDSAVPPLFHDCRGGNALAVAAKWLLDQRELRS